MHAAPAVVEVEVAEDPPRAAPIARGLHSSTSQLNFSRV